MLSALVVAKTSVFPRTLISNHVLWLLSIRFTDIRLFFFFYEFTLFVFIVSLVSFHTYTVNKMLKSKIFEKKSFLSGGIVAGVKVA